MKKYASPAPSQKSPWSSMNGHSKRASRFAPRKIRKIGDVSLVTEKLNSRRRHVAMIDLVLERSRSSRWSIALRVVSTLASRSPP